MRRFVMAMVVVVLACAATSASAAEPTGTLKKIKQSKTIVLGYRDSSWPFSFTGPDGKPAGYSVDLCTRIADAVEKELALGEVKRRWVKVTPENRQRAVVDGTIDLECGSTTATLSRMEKVDFTITTFVDGGSLLVADASGIRELKDLTGKRIGIVPGTTTETALAAELRKAVITVQMVAVKDHAEGLAALEAGTVDAYASDRVILIGLGRGSKDASKLSLSTQLFSHEPYALMLRRGDADFRLTANRALSRIYRSEDIVRIYDKWFGEFGRPSIALQLMYAITVVPE